MRQQSSEIKKQVEDFLANEGDTPISNMVERLGLTEGEITFSLPENMFVRAPAEQAQTILEKFATFGKVTTIVHSGGSIFEFKADFPKGKCAHGYYNLMGKEGQLHGHLRIDLITDIAFVSKPFRGTESHYVGFFDTSGHCIFKIYLGRDAKRQLFSEQIERFNEMKMEWTK